MANKFSKLKFDRVFSDKLTMQQEVASAFLKTFQLSYEEKLALQGGSREEPVTMEYFTVLSRVQVK